MSRPRHLLVGAAATIVALVAATGVGVSPAAAAAPNMDPNYLVVYNNNVENLLGDQDGSCKTFRIGNLISYMAAQPKSPDLFFVQQLSDTAQLNQLVARLNAEKGFGGATYAGVIAKGSPRPISSYTSGCKALKKKQTNAIIYRSDRLTLQKQDTVIADLSPTDDPDTCTNAVPQDPDQDRAIQVKAQFWDKAAKRTVNAISMHWPTYDAHGTECALANWDDVSRALTNLGPSSLSIAAGDTNVNPTAPSGAAAWWNTATAAGYRDPVAEKCGARDCPGTTDATFHSDTSGWHRYDVLLAKRSANVGDAFSKVATIPNAGATAYSEHRAIVAYVKYRQD